MTVVIAARLRRLAFKECGITLLTLEREDSEESVLGFCCAFILNILTISLVQEPCTFARRIVCEIGDGIQ
jgi:hypothetical protein